MGIGRIASILSSSSNSMFLMTIMTPSRSSSLGSWRPRGGRPRPTTGLYFLHLPRGHIVVFLGMPRMHLIVLGTMVAVHVASFGTMALVHFLAFGGMLFVHRRASLWLFFLVLTFGLFGLPFRRLLVFFRLGLSRLAAHLLRGPGPGNL